MYISKYIKIYQIYQYRSSKNIWTWGIPTESFQVPTDSNLSSMSIGHPDHSSQSSMQHLGEAERKPQQEEGGQRDLLGRQEPGTGVEH